jgi:hypothetical protein
MLIRSISSSKPPSQTSKFGQKKLTFAKEVCAAWLRRVQFHVGHLLLHLLASTLWLAEPHLGQWLD